VSALGYGLMVLEGFYGGVKDPEAVKTIRHALRDDIDKRN
jgi:hypothetical protein